MHWIQQCPYCSSNCGGRGTFMSFTVCTTVCQVRGSSPVPSLLHTQFSTSCNIQSSTSDLSSCILSMMAGSTCKNVPNLLHLASSFPSRALITSTWHTKIEIALHRQGECHTELSLKKADLANEYIESAASHKHFIPSKFRPGWQTCLWFFCLFKCHKHQIWSHVCTVNFVQHCGYNPPLKYYVKYSCMTRI